MPIERVLFPGRQVTHIYWLTIAKGLKQFTLYVRMLQFFTACPTGFSEQPLMSVFTHRALNDVSGDEGTSR